MKVFDTILQYFFYFSFISFSGAIVGIICLIKQKKSDNKEDANQYLKIAKVLIIQLVIYFIILFSTNTLFNHIVKHNFIETLESNSIIIKINNSIIDTTFQNKLLVELKNIRNISTSHSGPQERIKIEVIANLKSTKLELGRDSNTPDLYWVFVTNYETTTNNDIGLIKTNLLRFY